MILWPAQACITSKMFQLKYMYGIGSYESPVPDFVRGNTVYDVILNT